MNAHFTKRYTVAPLVCLSLLLVVSLFAGSQQSVFISLNQLAQSLPETLWQLLTTLSDPLVAPLLAFTLFYKQPLFIRTLLIAVMLGIITNYALKYGFSFPRPHELLSTEHFTLIGAAPSSPSFPSGHTLTIFLIMSVISHWYARARLTLVLFGLAAIISFARIAVGVHFLSDVLFGALLGWFIGWLAMYIQAKLEHPMTKNYLLGIYFTGLFVGIYALVNKTHYPDGQWLSTAIALFTVAYSLKSITEQLHRQKG